MASQTGGFRHVAERSIAIVVVEAIPISRVGFIRQLTCRHRVLECSAIDEEQIEPTVSVVIEHSDAPAHGLQQIFLGRQAGFVFEFDAGTRGDIGKRR